MCRQFERKILIPFLILLLSLSVSCASRFKLNQARFLHPGGWESFRGNNKNTGYAKHPSDVPQPIDTPDKLLWSFEVKRPIKSSPVIAKGILFIGSLDKRMFFVDALSGENLGSQKISTSISSSACVGDSILYFAQDKGKETFFALNLLTGDFLWKEKLGDISSSPQIYQEKIFIGSDSGLLLAFNRFSGEKIWEFKAGDVVISTPACDGEILCFGSGDDNLYALDKENGELKWKFKAEASIYSSPAIKVENPANGGDDKVFLVADSLVYIGSNDYFMYAVNQSTGKLRWKFETRGIIHSSPIAVGDRLFFGSYDGNLYALDRFSGKLLWKYKTKGMISSSPAYSDGKIYIASEDGYLYCFGF
ncbi:hypothetical protein AMJ44_06085 [candidate division WOR-1 bacterium DG_54_3]|uniref:Pyrrolo-quinoline quinone repeat domain-containing protein n=1 Tax=candidate division WOR-1 bacterium DG_54_3 TaxID=1703775 RepID=A0A0S7Y1K1_UNCSA|nr:MAG: hypothetical protein AMJ44_06085 [candidate division WOR-1 bacterium DG_54_3]